MNALKRKKRKLPGGLQAALLALSALTLTTLPASEARADNTTTVAPIHLVSPAFTAGKYANVFFVRAAEAFLGIRGTQLEFTEIKTPILRGQLQAVTMPDGTQGAAVDFPASQVPWRYANGVMQTYNYVFVAITEAQPNPLYLKNTNGMGANAAPVIDPRISAEALAALPDAAFQTVTTGFISKAALSRHLDGQGHLVLDLLTDLSQDPDTEAARR